MSRVGVGVALAAALLAVYVLRLDHVAGLYVDDAYYVVLAQALAQGRGYLLISSATGPILPAFPPGFALLLAPVIAVTPAFPANVIALKAVSIAAMLGVAWLTYIYMVRYRALDRARSATIAMITAILPGFVFLATSTMMAECVFALSLVASVVAIERAAGEGGRSRTALVVAAVISTTSWLIRSAGIASVIAGAVFFIWRRGWRASSGFVAICAICYSPWAIYSAAHAPTIEERQAHGGSIVYDYGALLSMRVGGEATSGDAGTGDLVRRMARNAANVFGRDLGAVVLPAGYRGAEESGQEVFQLSGESGLMAGSMGRGAATVAVSSALSLFMLIGWVVTVKRRPGVAELLTVLTIVMVVLVPARTFRYVLMIAPFLVSYFLAGIEAVIARWRGAAAAFSAFRVAAASLALLLIIEHTQYIAQRFMGPQLPWIADGDDVRSMTDWIGAQLDRDGGIATTNPGLVYLATGHRTVAFVDPIHNWQRWRDSDIRYAVALHVIAKPGVNLNSRMLHETPRLKLWAAALAPVTLTESVKPR